MYNEVIYLVTLEEVEQLNGDLIPTESKKELLAKERSIGMREKYEALSKNLHPELTMIIADYLDYNNEKYVDYDSGAGNIRYEVLRTFKKEGSDELEIVLTR